MPPQASCQRDGKYCGSPSLLLILLNKPSKVLFNFLFLFLKMHILARYHTTCLFVTLQISLLLSLRANANDFVDFVLQRRNKNFNLDMSKMYKGFQLKLPHSIHNFRILEVLKLKNIMVVKCCVKLQFKGFSYKTTFVVS